jgi:excinuclease ABC subunit C
MSTMSNLKTIAASLPEKPGVYQFLNETGTILYVEKASNIRKRVISYFLKNQSGKTNALLQKARDIKHIVVDNESDALLLENNIIKKNQPRYNVLLKDDKTFPWICIKKERFPRLFITRSVINDGSLYYGPYTSVVMVRTLLSLIRHLYPIRTCTLNLCEENIKSGKLKVCLEYHLGNCKGPCIDKQEEEDYNRNISHIKEILKGNFVSVNDYLTRQMNQFSKNLLFEEAQATKEKLDLLKNYRSKSTIVNPSIKDIDVFGFSEEGDNAYVTYLKVIHGAVIQAYTLEMKRLLNEGKESLLSIAVLEIRKRLICNSSEILVPFKPDFQLDNVMYTVPKIGDRKKLLELAERNAIYYKLEQKKKRLEHTPELRTGKNLDCLKKDLHMAEVPVHIECFDNSNIQGTNPVAACVVFRNARPSKKEYRHFNIKTVAGPDDFASMEEVIYRRYKRMLDENTRLPQLIVIDGGKGQLSSALKSLRSLGLADRISIIGIAKKLEEIYFPGDSIPLYLDKNSISLKIIQNLRNEAHRFGIKFHRDKRSKEMTTSDLDSIKGIGPKTSEALLKHFGSVEEIKKATSEELEKAVGKQKAALLTEYFNRFARFPRETKS